MLEQVTLIYFSPTGNTRKTLEAMGDALAPGSQEAVDVTVDPGEGLRQFGAEDFVIFGAPVYGGRIPAVARQRLERFYGEDTPCLVVVTYGNRDFDDALLELAQLAASHGFHVRGGAAVVGRHTYGEIQVDRPDEGDLQQDRDFALRAAAKSPQAPPLTLPGHYPYREGGTGGKFRPLTGENCVSCGLCAKNCPVQAIGPDYRTVSDACLSCFRCIRDCPAGAKNMETPDYRSFAQEFTKRLSQRRENQYFL